MFLFHSELDCSVLPINYTDIHAALLCFTRKPLEGKRVLEIGPNYGPYMHYLQNKHGMVTSGIDRNNAVIQYAVREGGLNFVNGDASELPFEDGSFDIVVSNSFLDLTYLAGVYQKTAIFFMENVALQVLRVLKNGGYYFSQNEDITEYNLYLLNKFRAYSQLRTPFEHSAPVIILQK